MMQILDVVGYVLASVTVLVLTITLAAPLVRQRMLIHRLRRDLKMIDHTVMVWARDLKFR